VGAAACVAALTAYGVSCVDNGNASDPCPKYCGDIMATCTGVDQQYPDNATCLRICGGINGSDAGGNDTIACRSLNVSSAKDEQDPAAKHLDCVGGGIAAINCGASQCAAFCNAALALCTGSNAPYPTQSDCVAACGAWGPSFDGQLLSSTGDTLQCRTYHLELSQSGNPSDIITHCSHTKAVSARCNDGGAPPPPDGGTDAAPPGDAAGD
jgi:hypothetical protein